jgi:hypothetical protein
VSESGGREGRKVEGNEEREEGKRRKSRTYCAMPDSQPAKS